jgi:hypothetical protein
MDYDKELVFRNKNNWGFGMIFVFQKQDVTSYIDNGTSKKAFIFSQSHIIIWSRRLYVQLD